MESPGKSRKATSPKSSQARPSSATSDPGSGADSIAAADSATGLVGGVADSTPAEPRGAEPGPDLTPQRHERATSDHGQEAKPEKLTTLQRRRGMSDDALWGDLRQGARNVAGVTWQVNVCVYLVVASRAGRLSFVDLLPEGFEDADCHSADGSRTFIQTKEMDAGGGQMSVAAIADALAHAEASARGREVVLVTDGSLASQVEFTGWGVSLDREDGPGRDRIVAGLVQRDHTTDQAEDLLRRSRLVHLPYRIRQESEVLLTEALSIHPAVAGIVVDRLTQIMAKASADQRRTTASTAARIRVSDIDAVVAEVQETVDVAGLDAAVADGVCSPVSFVRDADLSANTFYLGVDGEPGHVAADLDVIRLEELEACEDGLRNEQSVLLTGPSGSGKSVLLWRAARDLVSSARVVRVRRLLDARDAVSLARYVRLSRPTETSPVLVVADNLGRPEMTAWTTAGPALRELTHVMLLGAARSEDFSPALLVGTTRVVEPRLSSAVAHLMSERMVQAGVTPRMAPEEAFERSEGLLMEYVALLSTGQRLRQVLAAQVVALADPSRQVQREAARLVATAHTLGLSLRADRLGAALTDKGSPVDTARIGDALGALRDEHIVVRDGDRWRGLHELRSSVLSELLHENPPPRVSDSLSRLSGFVDPVHIGWMLRRVAERIPESVPEVVEALSQRYSVDLTARELAALLEGAERADNVLYVRKVLPILESRRPDGLTLSNLALFTYARRNQGQRFDPIGVEAYDNAMRRVSAVAESLPLRSAFETTVSSVCQELDSRRLTTILGDADLLDVLRVLEAGSRRLRVPLEAIVHLAHRMQAPQDLESALLWSRLVAASAPHLTPAQVFEVWGTPAERAETLCRADPLALSVKVDGTAVQVIRLLPLDGSGEMPPLLPWDVHRPGASDSLNEATVACLQRIKEACPELERFEITTVTADGQPYRIADSEPGHKNMPRKNFADRDGVLQSVGFHAALRRATASQTWTEIVNTQIDVAQGLTVASQVLPLRFKARDNVRRRAEWRSRLDFIRRQISDIKPPPLIDGAGPDSAMALSDYADREEDATTRVLSQALEAISRACEAMDPDDANLRPIAVAMGLRDAASVLAAARQRASASFEGRGEVLPEALIQSMRVSADLAAALQIEPGMARRVRADDPLGTSAKIWHEVAQRRAAESASVLSAVLGQEPRVTFGLVNDPSPASWSLLGGSWVVFAPMELLDEVIGALEGLDDDAREKLENVVVLAVALSDHDIDPDGDEDEDARADAGTGSAKEREADAGEGEAEPEAGAGPDLDRLVEDGRDVPWAPLGPQKCLSLGIGFQLASRASREAFPIPPDRVEVLSRAANLGGVRAGAGVAEILESLMARSHEVARRKLRQLPQPLIEKGTMPSEGRAAAAAAAPAGSDSVAVETPEPVRAITAESAKALARLERQVEDEEAGRTDRHLVEVVTRGVRGETLDELTVTLLEAMAALHISGLQPLDHVDVSLRRGASVSASSA